MKKTLLMVIALFIITVSSAQRSEIGAFAGTSFYIGDLNPTTIFASPMFSGGIIYRYNLTPRWAIKADIIFANVQGSDEKNNHHYERNLSFHSPITEVSTQLELNFLKLYNSHGHNRFSPYIFAGIGVFSFNPKAELNGVTYDLQGFGTEGQGFPDRKDFYSLTNICIPFGIGIKYNIGRYISIGAEWGLRYTFTDYLDDVSGTYYDNTELELNRGKIVAELADRSDFIHEEGTGRGNVTTKDLYSFAGITFTFKIGNEDKTCEIKHKANIRKPLGKKY